MFRKLIILTMILLPAVFLHKGIITSADEPNYVNPSYQEINQLLTEAAIQKNIPPEVVKAIAFQESSWRQFSNGSPLISSDNGIGIMQVTNDPRFDQDKLKTDIEYNINAGVQILIEKYNLINLGKLPALNNNDRNILESWYFAILAYNGQSQVNSPIVMADGSTNINAYQEKIYNIMEDKSNITGIYPLPFKFSPTDFTYAASPSTRLYFNTMNYQISKKLLHPSNYGFTANDIVLSADGANFRQAPTTASTKVGSVQSGNREALTVMSPFEYGTSSDFQSNQYAWYKVTRQDGSVAYTASGTLIPLGKRLYGSDRYATAAAISKEGWPNGADTVVLAKGTNFPDALAGTPLAYSLDAPLLLTDQTLPKATYDEIVRLKPQKVILLGGPGAVTVNVETQLRNMGITIQRYGGLTRFDTANNIANNIQDKGDTAIVVYGYNFPDALSIAPYAAKHHYPIFLTDVNQLPSVEAAALKTYKKTIVVGADGVISNLVFKNLNSPTRYGGATRYDTNASIVNGLPMGSTQAFMATGLNFADALAGAVLAAKNDSYLLLTLPQSVPSPIQTVVNSKNLDYFDFLGGKAVVGVENEIGQIVEGN
jgi:putative cell wall-binding protein